MGVIRSRGFVPSFSPFVSDPKSEPSVIRPGLPVLVSTSHTVAARRRSYQYPAYGRARAQEDETNLSFGPSRPEGRGGRPLGSAGTKADACKPDGAPLFARRLVHTESFIMSAGERVFYDRLREYLQDGFDLAKRQ